LSAAKEDSGWVDTGDCWPVVKGVGCGCGRVRCNLLGRLRLDYIGTGRNQRRRDRTSHHAFQRRPALDTGTGRAGVACGS